MESLRMLVGEGFLFVLMELWSSHKVGEER